MARFLAGWMGGHTGLQTKLVLGTGSAVLALVVSTAVAHTLAQENTPPPALAVADEAVQQVAAATGEVYAGDCAATRSPQDLGKLCSRFVASRFNLRAYLVGRTFGEFSEWVFVEQTEAGWRPFRVTPLDESASALVVPWPAA